MTAQPSISGPTTPEALQHAVWGGTRAVAIAQAASQLITLAGLAILFRLLDPAAYGLLGMVLPVLFFLRIFTKLGLNVATVQRPDLSAAEVSALFWVNLALGVATAAATALLAPAVAWFYEEPRLTTLTAALAGTALAVAFGAQHQALLERRMRLGRVAACRVTAQLIAALAAIAAALAGWGVWALVVQQYVEAIAGGLFFWIAEPWRPTRPSRAASVAEHLRFGGYYSAGGVMFFLAGNLDKILVGRWLGEYALGLYGQAFNLMLKPVALVTEPLTGVMLSALSRAAGDPEARRALLAGFYRLAAIALLPAGVGLALVGDQAMLVLGGEKWSQAGTLIAVLGLAVIGQGLVNIAGPVFTSAGRTDRMFFGAVALTVVLAAAYVAGWWLGGQAGHPLLGVAWGYALAMLVALMIPYTVYCLWASGHRAGPVLATLVRPALAALGMGVLVLLARHYLAPLPTALQLLLEILIGVAGYALFARREIAWLWSEIRVLRGE
jgi:PST family polysaccharide transporter